MAKLIMPRSRPAEPSRGNDSAENALSVVLENERSERVLLLEDEEQTNLVLKEYLQSLGYSVVAVSNGVDGLREVMKSDFELVICDMMMPRLPGDMFFIAVQKTRPKLCQRFVFITGHQETPTVGSFMAESGAAILVKPFRLKQLEITLEEVLSRLALRARAPVQPLRIVHMPESDASSIRGPEADGLPFKSRKEAIPTMVRKALKVVGFLRGSESDLPQPLADLPLPRVTRRIAAKGPDTALTRQHGPSEIPKTTRRIATKPLDSVARDQKPAADIPKTTRRISAKGEAATADLPKTTRKIATKAPEALLAKKEEASPQVTRRLAATADLTARPIIRVPAAQQLPKTTIRLAAAEKIKTTIRIPKVTQTIPKTTIRIPKTTVKIPRTTIKIPDVAAKKPQVTIRVKNAAAETSKSPASELKPAVTRRIAAAKAGGRKK